ELCDGAGFGRTKVRAREESHASIQRGPVNRVPGAGGPGLEPAHRVVARASSIGRTGAARCNNQHTPRRPGAAPTFLLLREYDAPLVVVIVHNHHLHPHSRMRPGAPSRSSIRSTANNTNKYRIETPNNRFPARAPSSRSPRATIRKDSPIIAAPAAIATAP